jgi:ABC-type sugar transport system ATPase subunit
MAMLRLDDVHKLYANGYHALRGLNLTLLHGELMVLVGPSGSGKSTALRIVAGLESPTNGHVYIDARDVTACAPRERDVAMVFQSYALYPHKTVRDNLAFGLRMRGLPRAEIDQRTSDIADRLALGALLDRKPAELSGGQRQRVALGRALVRVPQVFLLDEPLSNLDAKLRAETRAEIARLHAALQVTTLYVTHDQEEAMTLGDRIAVMGERGTLEQLATPLELYREPCNRFVAEFIGMPRINWFEGEIEGDCFRCMDFEIAVPDVAPAHGPALLGVRPHDLALVPTERAALRAKVELTEPLGATILVHASTPYCVPLRMIVPADAHVQRGHYIGVELAADRLHVFDRDTGTRQPRKRA